MSQSTIEYLDVGMRFSDLGCRYPICGIALLPVNFETVSSSSGFLHASEAPTLRKLFKEEGVPVADITTDGWKPMYRKDKAHEWVAPVIFISATLYTQNPSLVSIILGVVSNYATDFLKGANGSQVRLEVVVETGKKRSFKKISYIGPAEEIKHLAEAVKGALDD